jgi:hypothetical protein
MNQALALVLAVFVLTLAIPIPILALEPCPGGAKSQTPHTQVANPNPGYNRCKPVQESAADARPNTNKRKMSIPRKHA